MPPQANPSQRECEPLETGARYLVVSRDMFCSVGRDGYFGELHGGWTQALGWTPAQLRSRPFVDFVHPLDREPTRGSVDRAAQGGAVVDFVNRCAAAEGGWIRLEWRATVAVGDAVLYASAREATRRGADEEPRPEAERQARQIIETARDAFIALDGDGVITAWNAQSEALFGWPREAALGRDLADLLIPEAHRRAHRLGIKQFLSTGRSRMLGRRVELVVLHRSGYEFVVEMSMAAMETSVGWSFNAFLHDITERMRVAAELTLARDEALDGSRMKSTFLANMSHEIRTPMNGVIGMTELLLATDLDDDQRGYAQTISFSGEALLMLIDDILDLAKVEAGKIELDPTDFDLADLIERVCAIHAPRAQAQGIDLKVLIGSGVPALVRADAGRLRQVINNFVSNAVKFTADGEVVVQMGARPVGDDSALVRVAVSDTGIGIDAEVLARLFKPFQQADSSTTRKYGGTGLGLAISSHLIALMGGEVGAGSEPGQGSTFWFELPLACPVSRAGPAPTAAGAEENDRRLVGVAGPALDADADAGGAGPAADAGAVSAGRSRQPLILVVDDTPVNQTVAVAMLARCGFRSRVAADGREALEILANESFAAILMDCQMPVLDGYETTREIRLREQGGGRRTPIVAMTAGSTEGERQRCTAVGMDDFLSKPLRMELLKDTLGGWLAGSGDGSGAATEAASPARAATTTSRTQLLDEAAIGDLERLGRAFLPELLSWYFDGVEAGIANLAAAIGRGETSAIARIAHQMKGSSATVGAARASSIAAAIEECAKAGDLSAADGMLGALRDGVAETRTAFRARGVPLP